MAKKIDLSPVTRIEGHLGVHTECEQFTGAEGVSRHRITRAECMGEMFRGFEKILQGRDPLDAQQFVQRICGVCPISHGVASCRAQEMAYGIRPNRNGRILQNLILAANFIQSHVLHFYTLSALDFVDVTAVLKYTGKDRKMLNLKAWVQQALATKDMMAVAPFLPRSEGDYIVDADTNCTLIAHYVEALEIRRLAHEMAAVFGARLPHSTALVPGGCTQVPTLERVLQYRSRLKEIEGFVEGAYKPDIVTAALAFPQYWKLGASYGHMLSYGAFDVDDAGGKLLPEGAYIDGKWEAVNEQLITEEVASSKFSSPSKLHPSKGETEANPKKTGAYSWIKAPRYKDLPMEVGPLARVVCAMNAPGGAALKQEVNGLLNTLGVPEKEMNSVLGRHLSRVIETQMLIKQMYRWLDELEIDGAPAVDFSLPARGSGFGLVEAPRGALGHWLTISDYKIQRYECVVPTTWNCSPRDDSGRPGPVEKALEGLEVADPEHPIEVGRVVRSFDPCIACAVH